jgi:hypothetical protein
MYNLQNHPLKSPVNTGGSRDVGQDKDSISCRYSADSYPPNTHLRSFFYTRAGGSFLQAGGTRIILTRDGISARARAIHLACYL